MDSSPKNQNEKSLGADETPSRSVATGPPAAKLSSGIFQDWEVNKQNPKGRFVLAFFRLCQIIRNWPAPFWYLGIPILAAYVVIVIWIFGIELDYRTKVGPALRLYHGMGLVIHQDVIIGANCMIRHNTTIGLRGGKEPCPVLGDRVEIGAHSIVMGPIKLGDGCIVGAGSVVLHDVEAGHIVAGNPARVIRKLDTAT
ncbi:MAG: serine O-acetyltransferase [Chthoniobacterales bacterium]